MDLIRRSLLLALFVASSALATENKDAKLLHEDGRRHHENRDYEAAARAFRDSLSEHPDRAGTHYALASALARLREAGKACEHHATLDDVLDHLERAAELGPDRVERMKKDRDLESVRRSFRFQKLLGRTPKDDAHIASLLTGPEWRGPVGALPGAKYGSGITFRADGTVDRWSLVPRDPMRLDGPARKRIHTGRWTAANGVVTVTFDDPDGEKTATLLFGDDGVLSGDGLRFTEADDDCP